MGRRLSEGGAAGTLQLVELAAGLVALAAKADGTAAEAEDFCQRQVWGGGLAQRLKSMQAEADDIRGETKFFLGFDIIGGERLGGGVVLLRHLICCTPF